MPVVVPFFASTETVKAHFVNSVFFLVIKGNFSPSSLLPSIGTQTKPLASLIIKLIFCGVAFSAAITKSASFSRCLSSITTTNPPFLKSLIASLTFENVILIVYFKSNLKSGSLSTLIRSNVALVIVLSFFSVLLIFFQSKIPFNHHVISYPSAHWVLDVYCIAYLLYSKASDCAYAVADELRRREYQHFVNNSSFYCRAVQLRAPLYHHACYLMLSKLLHQILQINHPVFRFCDYYGCALVLKPLYAAFWSLVCRSNNQLCRLFHEIAAFGYFELAVHYDFHRVFAFNKPGGELGIVPEHCV